MIARTFTFTLVGISSWVGLSLVAVGQDAVQVMPAIQLRAARVVIAGANAPANERDHTARKWVRGLIQQELNGIQSVCKLNDKQAKSLVDLIETEWRSKFASVFRSYSEANQRGGVDFEFRVESAIKAWLREVDSITEEQRSAWNYELDSRNELRRRIVIGKMVSDAERKFGLSSKQMKEVEALLHERWKEAWWVMYRNGTTPETKFAWISTALSDAQRTAGADTSGIRQEYYTSGGSVDLPSKPLADRFTVAGVTSDESIPLQPQPAEADKADKKEP
ncbi:MAG: hypothetical protein ACKOAU_03565 [Pirellula sp.]|jgi:hypothetical protein